MGKLEAKMLVDFVESKADKTNDEKSTHLASKEDILNLSVDMEKLRGDTEKEFRNQSQWILEIFITMVILIPGLYVTAIFKS